MKQMKTIILSLVLCALCAGATAQTVTVADVEALPGETVAFTLNLTGGKASTYTAMQFDAHFPATGFATTGKYSVSELWENATATIGAVDANGIATIPVASSESISAADVEGLLSVSFTVGSDVAIDEYEVTLKDLWFGYGTSSKDYLDDVSFKVKVVAAHTIVLDETSTTAPVAATGVDVRVKRSIKANSWSTICLPFAIPAEKMTAAFGEGVEVKNFTGYDIVESGDDIVGITISFESATAIEANHPYLIKVANAITAEEGFTVDGVDIAPEDEPVVSYGFTTGKGSKAVYHPADFIGTYVAEITLPENDLFISNNRFYYSAGETKMKAYRAYFEFDDVLTALDEAGARITMIDSETTGITEYRGKMSDDTYYDLQGRKVESPRKGVYIVNGSKIAVK